MKKAKELEKVKEFKIIKKSPSKISTFLKEIFEGDEGGMATLVRDNLHALIHCICLTFAICLSLTPNWIVETNLDLASPACYAFPVEMWFSQFTNTCTF